MDTQNLSIIITNVNFNDRIRYFLTKAALAILSEDPATVNHDARVALSVKILSFSIIDVSPFVYAVLTNPTIAALVDPTTATDNDLEFVVNSIIDPFSTVISFNFLKP
jgi:tRNA G26 N,N-dimethylase Trm1